MDTYSKFSDAALADLLKSGDRVAFTEIYNRYKGLLYIHAFKILKDREEAKDVVQQFFSVLWTKHEELTFKVNLSQYMYTSIRNLIFRYISRKKIESTYITSIQIFFDEGVCETDHLIREHELRFIIEREIANLPPKMREIFEMSRKVNLSHKEIADQLSISEQTVSKQITNALKILRTKLGLVAYIVFLIGH
ncbi:RNA polymerase sigma-70 factor [Pedobacter sp.]|uniref:RNA polymerase sigma-70 factor n=1 Tax=Pedobacter sp. TaxID=1411316 RepID=UPI002C93197E|nr:RNA polymerase sigma-70 factor [Pedobacter sp.]HWW39878.1 RNA polymerase sigma-70 factor [Pedobacter sp.]